MCIAGTLFSTISSETASSFHLISHAAFAFKNEPRMRPFLPRSADCEHEKCFFAMRNLKLKTQSHLTTLKAFSGRDRKHQRIKKHQHDRE